MKHGIYYAYWEKEWEADYVKYVKKVSKLGFDILEIGAKPLPNYTKDDIKKLRNCAEEYNITLTCGYGPNKSQNIATEDKEAFYKAIDWYKSLFEVMQALNIHYLGGAIYFYWPVDYTLSVNKEKDRHLSIIGMQKLASIAKEYEIILGAEVLNRFEGYLLNTAAEGVAYVKDVSLDNVKVHLDTFHMSIEEESIPDAIRNTGKYLGHLHTGQRNRNVPSNKGDIAWDKIGEALNDIRYNGAAVIEAFVKRGGSVEKDIKIWHNLMDDLSEENLDICAKEALEFQRKMFDR